MPKYAVQVQLCPLTKPDIADPSSSPYLLHLLPDLLCLSLPLLLPLQGLSQRNPAVLICNLRL